MYVMLVHNIESRLSESMRVTRNLYYLNVNTRPSMMYPYGHASYWPICTDFFHFCCNLLLEYITHTKYCVHNVITYIVIIDIVHY